MSYNLIWIFLLILQTFVASLPLPNQYDLGVSGIDKEPVNSSLKLPKHEDSPDEQVISVRITSSVAVGRGKGKSTHVNPDHMIDQDDKKSLSTVSPPEIQSTTISLNEDMQKEVTEIPPSLIGANIEYLKQINAKKESREHNSEPVHPFQLMVSGESDNSDESLQRESSTKIDQYDEDIPLARKVPSAPDANRFQEQNANRGYHQLDSISPIEYYAKKHHINITFIEPPIKFGLRLNSYDNKNSENMTSSPIVNQQFNKTGTRDIEMLTAINTFVSNSNNYHTDDSIAESSIKSAEFAKFDEEIDDVPPKANMSPAPNNIHGFKRPLDSEENNPRLTTVSFKIVHDTPKVTNDNEPSNSFIASSQLVPNQQTFYNTPKIYSEPSKIYSEPAKFYSEPSKIYSEPAKIYSEPAKVYSEPAKVYSVPSKFYSQPASLHLDKIPPSGAPNYPPWQRQRPIGSTTMNTTPLSTVTNAYQLVSTRMDYQPEKNYEVDEKDSVISDGRSHGVQQETTTEKCKQDNCKVGYVVEGRQFKKYRVEERTPDGFIVGEYGVVRNEDGALRGVRYTADSDASPRLIHDALMKFLQLK